MFYIHHPINPINLSFQKGSPLSSARSSISQQLSAWDGASHNATSLSHGRDPYIASLKKQLSSLRARQVEMENKEAHHAMQEEVLREQIDRLQITVHRLNRTHRTSDAVRPNDNIHNDNAGRTSVSTVGTKEEDPGDTNLVYLKNTLIKYVSAVEEKIKQIQSGGMFSSVLGSSSSTSAGSKSRKMDRTMLLEVIAMALDFTKQEREQCGLAPRPIVNH